ncbi:MAG: hypothetical protein IKI63_06760 [Clostridia bacterium]|nr:hypothetical protein [Clostridia bacterium]
MYNRTRWLALLLAGALALTLTACGQPADSTEPESSKPVASDVSDADRSAQMYELYQKSQEKADALTGTDVTLSGSYTLSAGSRASVTQVELSWQSMESDAKPDNAVVSDVSGTVIDVAYTDHLAASIVTGRNKNEYELYYDGGVMYRNENGQKSRQNVARSTALKDTALLQVFPLGAAAFESPVIATVEGNTIVSLPLPGDMLSDALLSENGAIRYILGSLGDPSLYTFHNVTVKLTFRSDGALTGYDIYYVMTGSDPDRTTLSVSMAAVFNHPDKNITVKLPDLTPYEDASPENDLNQEAYEAMPVIVDALFDADGNRVADYDSIYASLCKTYSKAAVDTVISWFEAQV